MSETKYYKLGKKANSFVDPKSGLSIANNRVVEIEASATLGSTNLTNALNNGHIIETDKAEFDKFSKQEVAALKAVEQGKPAPVVAETATSKKAAAKAEEEEEEEETEDDEEEEEEEEEETEEEEDEEVELTKPQLLEAIKSSTKATAKQKTNAKNMNLADLKKLHTSLTA